MKTLKQLERLRKVHKLIQQEQTGAPTAFAKKMHISDRELYRMLEYLKELDAQIAYCRKSNTYYYKESFDLLVNVSIKVMVKNELKTVYAGTTLLYKELKCAINLLY